MGRITKRVARITAGVMTTVVGLTIVYIVMFILGCLFAVAGLLDYVVK